MDGASLKKKILDSIWLRVKDYFYDQRVTDSPIVQNLNARASNSQKKAIICYLPYSFFNNWEETTCGRTQPFEILAIVDALSKLDYRIDLIDCNDLRALQHVESKRYDLIFGFGETFYHLTQQQPWAMSVLYMTEQHPEFSYREEQKRVDYYNQRHQTKLQSSRSGKFYQRHHLEPKYTCVIVMGEEDQFSGTYDAPYAIFPTGLLHPNFILQPKNQEIARKNFLWLGSPGAAIHKGLDLLTEVIANRRDLTLHIGGISDAEREMLKIGKIKNVIDHEYIDVQSQLFKDLVSTCAYIILPSCSEACATSVTTGMLHGLIPVVMKDAGFNRLGSLPVFLEHYALEYLDKELSELADKSPEQLELYSQRVYRYAHQHFTIDSFANQIETILRDIVNKYDKNTTPANTPAFVR
ncbi:glycosyltransferase family protein [Pontibacter oryzae]|uniref:Glycosyltransferase family 1 protein n=1 Tax=Pontibacter oryzae TaxID=2304593 RepID=A0A399SF94_9BACT|nr:hypothetical protein [Pontibacter oryzae]RIJ42300.1 hypothetical protein D1627_00015 [Pontibacter oryzae]